MAIKGFQGTSLLDYPGRIASLVFFSGCNLRCPYCHNPSLVLTPEEHEDIPLADVVEMLRQRRAFIDGLVVSGGEPTLDPLLRPLLEAVKKLGLLVKLDTNGTRPTLLQELVERQLVDFVSLDVKTAPGRYGELAPAPVPLALLAQSVEVLKAAPVEVEFRTTCMPGLVEEEDIAAMGALLRGASTWTLQQFVAEHALCDTARRTSAHSDEQIRLFAQQARNYVEQVQVRGLV
ncbi:MAG: anaerobic ribonucleoside-triphosphate reductase activating protein [Desulfuromonadaceae bacterium]|nr:anaerobic ribonucleoside-triphosphate reductase activating protein [Desulfuromonadaceae bacterium]